MRPDSTMAHSLHVLLGPADLDSLRHSNLDHTVCVVFDILRATSTMLTALAHGAEAILPVSEIDEALALRSRHPDFLLAGEREGLRIDARQTGGVEFDLGNSPREFTPERVQGRTIVMTTTNGTRSLRACAGARHILLGSFLNLRATSHWLQHHQPAHLLLVCSGTQEDPALEDVLAAGALCEKVWSLFPHGSASDSAEIARRIYALFGSNLLEAMRSSRNGRRLLAHPDLRDDVWHCVQRETLALVAAMDSQGAVRRLEPVVRSQ